MPLSVKYSSPLVLWVAFVIALLLAFVVAQNRYQLLDGNNIDYAYFLQFTLKAFSPTLEHTLTINPTNTGENMLFISGPDGAPSLWRWLHFEPIKIAPTLLYAFSGNLLVSYGFFIFFFFLPLLYGGYILIFNTRARSIVTLALLSAVVYPGSFLVATDYLRPWLLLMPLFICLGLSIIYRRPLVEKILFLILFLLIREEALILSAALLVWETLRNRRSALSQKEVKPLWVIWGAFILVLVFYYIHAAYAITPPHQALWLLPLVALAGIFFLLLLVFLWRRGVAMWKWAPEVVFAALALGPVLVFLVGVDPHGLMQGFRIILSKYGFTIFYIVVILIGAVLYEHQNHALFRKITLIFLSISIIFSLCFELLPHPSATWQYVQRWKQQSKEDRLVYEAAATIPKNTPTLLDMRTVVAFSDHDGAYAYNYLAYILSSTTGPRYPENTPALKKLIKTKIPYAVLANEDAEPLLSLIKESGQTPVLIEKNKTYSFYQIK